MKEVIDIYNANMELIGVADRDAVHANGYYHSCVHYWLLTKVEGVPCLLFSRRAEWKKTYPGLLCPAASGHIKHRDTYQNSVELEEEIGVRMDANAFTHLGVHLHAENHNGFLNTEFVYSMLGELPVPVQSVRFPDGEVDALVLISVRDCLKLFDRTVEEIEAQEYYLGREDFKRISVTLSDFVPDAQTPDAHYYRMAMYADLHLQGYPVSIPLPKDR